MKRHVKAGMIGGAIILGVVCLILGGLLGSLLSAVP